MANEKRYTPEPLSAPGDFYNVHGECVSCGVPHAVAPDLVGWVTPDLRHCYWIKQPESPGELERAFAIFDGQEVGCHRYAGTDPLIQLRVGSENCDNPLPRTKQAAASVTSLFSNAWGATPYESPFNQHGILRRILNKLTGR